MESEKLKHILFKKDWVNHFIDNDGKQVKLPDRFIAKDKEGRNIFIVTYTYNGGTMGHGMGDSIGFDLVATRICIETGSLINEDVRIREEGFWVQSTGVGEYA